MSTPMNSDLVAVVIGAVACGAAGLLVRPLVSWIPEPDPDPEHPKPSYREVAATPRLPALSVVLGLVAGGLVGAAIGLDWPLIFLLPLIPVGLALGIVDLRTRLLPTAVVRPTFVAVAVLASVSALLERDPDALVRAGLGAVVVFVIFFVLWWIHPPGMGYGDVRLSGVLGLALGYLGWAQLLVGIYGAFLAFSLPGLLLALLRRNRELLKTAYPFGPFLLVGALAGVVVGDPVWSGLVSG